MTHDHRNAPSMLDVDSEREIAAAIEGSLAATDNTLMRRLRSLSLAARVSIAALILAVACAWLGRFEVVAAPSSQVSAIYILDRWTGAMEVCFPSGCGHLKRK